MGKLIQDIPKQQRDFFKIFERIAYRHQYSEVFDDYLTMLINWFANGEQQEWRDQALKKYTPEEKQMLNEMFREHMSLFHKEIMGGRKWYDTLGDFYQTITSSWKASGMGQFFTPESICEMIARCLTDENKQPYSFVNEPAAGSGRMILAMHALQPLNFYSATDLDGMCAKMTAINMCMHNASGIVFQDNTLSGPGSQFTRAYFIDRVQVSAELFVPYLKVIDDYSKAKEQEWILGEYCRICRGEPRKLEAEVEPDPVPVFIDDEPMRGPAQIETLTKQLTLF